jgi:predicted dehydrogenase
MAGEEKMPVALIGLGGVGRVHFEVYREMPDVKIIAVAEPDAGRRAVAEAAGIPAFADHRSMLASAKPRVACVLTPVSTHEAIVADCAAAGVHVLCEKPLALSVASGRRMAEAAAAANVRLAYGASYRFLAAIRTAREMILAGTIGDVVILRETLIGGAGPESRRPIGPIHYPAGGIGGGPMGLIDHGIHLVDTFRWLAGSEIVAASGRGNVSGEAMGAEWMAMTFANGALGLLLYDDGTWPTELPAEGAFSWGAGWDLSGRVEGGQWNPQPGIIHVHGTKGALRIAHYANHLHQIDGRGIRQVPLSGDAAPAQFSRQLRSLLASVRTGQPLEVPAEEGVAALAAIERLYDRR